MILPLEKNVRFGLLCVACVPGGGLGHVAVIISKADLPLSLTMNLISTVTMLGKVEATDSLVSSLTLMPSQPSIGFKNKFS